MATLGMHTDVDAAKAEAFVGGLLTALNNGALCLMISVAYRRRSPRRAQR